MTCTLLTVSPQSTPSPSSSLVPRRKRGVANGIAYRGLDKNVKHGGLPLPSLRAYSGTAGVGQDWKQLRIGTEYRGRFPRCAISSLVAAARPFQ